jgi:plasmid stabilization system protein ParE
VAQLGAIAEHIAVSSPVYAEQVVDRVVRRLEQVQRFPESGRAPCLPLQTYWSWLEAELLLAGSVSPGRRPFKYPAHVI